jgi:hypothetical protein
LEWAKIWNEVLVPKETFEKFEPKKIIDEPIFFSLKVEGNFPKIACLALLYYN